MPLHDNPFFQAVQQHADQMLSIGRGPGDDPPGPLFAGVIDAGARNIGVAMMVPPPGIRIADFNWCGNNLMHDVPFLETLRALSNLTGDPRYGGAVDEVFSFYGKHCPHPETGLFPWGEHAQWSFPDRAILPCSFTDGVHGFLTDDYVIHAHLRFAPGWFWDSSMNHSSNAWPMFMMSAVHTHAL